MQIAPFVHVFKAAVKINPLFTYIFAQLNYVFNKNNIIYIFNPKNI